MEIVALVSLSACVLALLLAVRVISRPSDNPPAAWALALFLVSVSAFVADQIAYAQDWFARFPHAYAVANPFIAAIFPSLFLYVRGVTHPTARWSKRSLLHLILPLAVALLEIPTFFLTAVEKTAAARVQVAQGFAPPGEMIHLAILNLYALTYLALSWRCVHAGRDRLDENAAEGRSQSFRGLEAFIALLTLLTAVSAALDFTPWQFTGSLAVALASVVTVFTAFWLVADHEPLLKARQTAPAAEAPPAPETTPAHIAAPAFEAIATVTEAEPAPPPAPTLRPADVERLQRRLDKLLGQEQIHLDADLSLQTLADRAETTRHKMSAAIREIYGLTFYQLIARHRAQEAARRLRSKAGASRTISDIAFSVGFNTLSAFNAAFKAEFGVTPSKFRENSAEVPGKLSVSKSDSPKKLAK
jgi:AraC-like DNA-binding protein